MQKNTHSNNGRRGPCVHVLSGRVDGPKTCMFNSECYHCAFDQWLDYMDEANGVNLVRSGEPMDSTIRAMQVV